MSEIRANTVSNAAGTGPVTLTGQYAAKAWVNFNGTGTIATRGSGNVSSLTDNGSGNYTISFTNSLADANYSCVFCAGDTAIAATVFHGYIATTTSSAQTFRTYNFAGNIADCPLICLSFDR